MLAATRMYVVTAFETQPTSLRSNYVYIVYAPRYARQRIHNPNTTLIDGGWKFETFWARSIAASTLCVYGRRGTIYSVETLKVRPTKLLILVVLCVYVLLKCFSLHIVHHNRAEHYNISHLERFVFSRMEILNISKRCMKKPYHQQHFSKVYYRVDVMSFLTVKLEFSRNSWVRMEFIFLTS